MFWYHQKKSEANGGGVALNSLLRIFRVRREEAPTVLLMALYFFLAMACVSIVKSLQNGLYLDKVGFDWRLPMIYVALAVFSGPVVVFYRRLAGRHSNIWLGSATLLFFLLSVLLFSLLVGREQFWIYLAFYTWGGVFSVLLPTQGWVIASDLYTTREAKRVFALLGTGGIIGGACGGYYTALVAKSFGSYSLLIQIGVLLLAIQAVLWAIHRHHRQRLGRKRRTSRTASEGAVQTLRRLFESRYLGYLSGVVLMGGLLSTLVDLQYKLALQHRFTASGEQITQFFGFLLGTMFVFSALFQLFVTSPILRRFGVGFGLLVLPAGCLLGTLGVVVVGSFWSVVTLRAIDGCFRSSVDRTSLELLFVPLPGDQTAALKSFVNMVVFRFGDALGAAIFLIASVFPDPVKGIGVVVLLAAVLMIYLSLQLGEQYVKTLRRTLEIKSTPAARRVLQLKEAVAGKLFLTALESPNPTKVYFALQQLMQPNQESAEPQAEDFSSPGEEMVQAEMSGLYDAKSPAWLSSVAPLVNHSDLRVSAAAFHLMARHHQAEYLSQLRRHLSTEQIPSTLYLYYLNHHVKRPGEFLREPYVLRWCRQAGPHEGVLLARLMGKTRKAAFLPVLEEWMNGPPGDQTRAAIEAVGQYADLRFVEPLIQRLSANWSRQAARRALVQYSDDVVPRLIELLRDTRSNLSVRREIPPILTQICTPSSRAGLVAGLYLPDSIVSYRALKGLNKIRDFGDLSYGAISFFPVLQLWAKEYYELLNLDLLLEEGKGIAWKLLRKAVKERQDWTIEKIFRGLALFLPQGDAYFSYVGYMSNQHELRENAIELIDSRMKGEVRQTLLPIFEELNPEGVAQKGRELFKLSGDLRSILAEALYESDPWMKCCVIAAAAAEPMEDLRANVQQACQDVNPMVCEAAHWALANWGKAPC